MPSTMQPASAGDVKRMILAFSKGKMGKDGRDGTDGQDGYTPVPGVDYPTDAQIDAKIAATLAERNQLEPLVAESAEWLNENGDPTKVYIVPNTDGQGGKVYAYAETEVALEPDNVLAENSMLGDRDVNVGVVTGVRLSGSSGNEADAANVQLIFNAYLQGATIKQIVDLLKELHIPSPTGKEKWCQKSIDDILSNEKYVGDVVLMKTIRIGGPGSRRIKNRGEAVQYTATASPQAIITREQFEAAQRERERRCNVEGNAAQMVRKSTRYKSTFSIDKYLSTMEE
jgi:hypothetical protein